MKKKGKTTPVKVAILKIVYDAGLPAYHRLKSLIEDVHNGNLKISDLEKSALYESVSCAISLKVILEEFLSEAEAAKAEVLHVQSLEFKNLLDLAKVVEVSHRISFGNAGIWAH